MHGAIEYSCQVLNGTNKAGTLKKNDKGYYESVVGALNMTNNKGEYYDYASARKFFDEASDLVRMSKKGVLRGEYGHPKSQGCKNDDEFIERLLTIEEKSTCCHHRRIWLDFDSMKDSSGKPIIGIMSEVGPSGPYGDALTKHFENEHEDTCFSIRCFTMPKRMGGRVIKEMRHVVTFDYVNEPGIVMATKYHNPALEHHVSKVITEGTLKQVARNIAKRPGSNESVALPVQAMMSAMGWEVRDTPQAKRNFFELLRTEKL